MPNRVYLQLYHFVNTLNMVTCAFVKCLIVLFSNKTFNLISD